MTDTTMTLRSERRLQQRLWLWLAAIGRRRPAAHLDTLPDHLLRDIGVQRIEISRMAIGMRDDAKRISR